MAVNVQNYKKLTGKGTGEAKEYTVAEIADVYHPNLLVNGDFQINQRGQTTYTFNGEEWFQYFLDLWCVFGYTGNIDVKENGLAVYGNTMITQFVPKNEIKIGETYTVYFSINDESKIVKKIIGGETFDDARLQYRLSSNGNHIFGFKLNNETINWARVYEGDIAYPHVKNSYQDDLMECQRKIRYVYGTAPVPGYRNGNLAQYFLHCYIGMDSRPSIVDSNCKIGNIGLISATPIVLVSEDGEYITAMNISHSSIGSYNLQVSDASYRLEFALLLSCELLS